MRLATACTGQVLPHPTNGNAPMTEPANPALTQDELSGQPNRRVNWPHNRRVLCVYTRPHRTFAFAPASPQHQWRLAPPVQKERHRYGPTQPVLRLATQPWRHVSNNVMWLRREDEVVRDGDHNDKRVCGYREFMRNDPKIKIQL